MKTITKYFKIKIVLLMALFLFTSISTFATHFRYANLNWEVLSTSGSSSTVKYTVTASYYYGPGSAFTQFGNVAIGGTINTADDFIDGKGGGVNNLSFTVTSKNTVEKWVVGSTSFNITYPSQLNYTAYFRSCCRVTTLQPPNNGNSIRYRVETVVSLTDPTNSPPAASTPPIFYVSTNQTAAQIQVSAVDPDIGDVLTFGWAPTGNGTTTGTGLSSTFPTISSAGGLNTSSGAITLNTVGQVIGNQHAAQVIVTDGTGATTAVDFIIQIVGQSNPPQFDYSSGFTPPNGSVIKVQPGDPINFLVKASDVDNNSTVTLSASGVPVGASYTPPTNTGNPVTSIFAWTTSLADLGTRTVTFSAVDNFYVQAVTSVTLIVTLAPEFIPPTPATGVHNVVTPGANFSFQVVASDPDPNDVCQIVDIKGKDMNGNKIPIYAGVTYNPSPLPTSAGTTTTLNVSWTPTAAQWGHRHMFFTAEDTYNDQTDHEVSILVNTVPVFTSAPVLTVYSNQLYTYNITVSDPDQAQGDVLSILQGTAFPSWLTLTDNGNGTATLSGTPTIVQAGTHPVEIVAEDINHHYSPIPSQNFSIQVIPCDFSLSATETDESCLGSNDGSIDLTLTGAFGSPTYVWSGPNGFSATSQDVTGLAPGNYIVVVTSDLGCSETGTYSVGTTPDITPPTAAAQNLTVVLDANGNGSIPEVYSLDANSGTLPVQNSGSVVTSTSCNCPTGYVAVGYEGFAGCITDNFRLICKELNSDGTLGATTAVTCFSGGGSSTPFSTSLVGNEALVGFDIADADYQYQGSRVHLSVQGHGKSISDIANGNANNINTTSLTSLAGSGCYSSNPLSTTQFAPDGHVIVGMEVNSVAYSSGVRFNYAPISAITDLNNGSSDNCGIASIVAGQTQFTCADVGANTVSLTVTDLSGNTATTTAIVDVQDNTAPSITCPANIVANNTLGSCDSPINYTIVTDDNCSYNSANNPIVNGSFENNYNGWTISSTSCGIWVIGTNGQSLSSGQTVYNYGTNTNSSVTYPQGLPITFASTDGNKVAAFFQNCSSTHSMYQDVTLPYGNMTLDFDFMYKNFASGGFSTNQFTAIELVDPLTNITLQTLFKTMPGDPQTIPMTGFSYNVSAYAGQTVRIRIIDAVINANPLNVFLDNIRITGGVTLTQTAGLPSGSNFPVGTTTNTFVATDASGNSSTCSFDVTVNDSEAPVVTCPATISVPNDAGVCGAVVTFASTVTDNCAGATVVSTPASGSLFPVGITNVTSVATDAAGNTATCTFVVTVNDTEDPVISCPATITVSNDPGICGAYVNYAATVTDNCPGTNLTYSIASGSLFNVGPTNVTVTATDAAGNTASCNFDVVVNDLEIPNVLTQNIAIPLINGSVSISGIDVDNGSSDNCEIESMSVSPFSFTCDDIGQNTVTLTVNDIYGNTATGTATVDVVGVLPSCAISSVPSNNVFTGGVSTTLYLGYGAQSTTLDVAASGGTVFTYNWSGNTSLLSSTTSADPVFTPTAAGSETYVVTVTNEFGCNTTCSITINVIDARCGKKNNKVLVCHNGHEICISPNAVPAHLNNHFGDNLGPCTSSNKNDIHTGEGFDVIAYPSPYTEYFNIEVHSDFDNNVNISVYDLNGKLLEMYQDVNPHNIPNLGNGFANGMYIVVVSQDGNSKTIKVSKM